MDIEFSSLIELYERLKPALNTKKNEMQRQGYKYIKEEDVWNYLKEKKWKSSKNLALYEMVSDILNCDNAIIDDYLREKLNSTDRKIYYGEQDEEETD
ncbi:MAG: post-transcriptional regulator [Bacilli bacterium]|nr:post-transcriptional regulator [Bacilli bacterium]MDD4733724.1 post-transcriptional regulator [Bacilli bacterium]